MAKSMWKQSSISRDWSASYRGLTIRIKVDPETGNPTEIEFSLQVADGPGIPAKPWHRRWQIKFRAVNAYAAFTIDDEFFFDVLGDRINPATGLLDDPTPPFKLYLSNENQLEDGVNPFAPKAF